MWIAAVAHILLCCGYSCRLGATALIQALAWELPYPKGAALIGPKKKKVCVHILVLNKVEMWSPRTYRTVINKQ